MLIILLIQQLHSCSVRRVPHRLNFSDPLVFHLLQKTICFGIVSVNYTLESVDEKTCLSFAHFLQQAIVDGVARCRAIPFPA